ncbi:glycosyltransferase family 2 protein [Candidatus Saccharibacteria bacterium]|nr:glycosyltransferase family 2 protein [Candidatus Saccharibacteria bacterium]
MKSSPNKRVSVIVPNYNYGKYLRGRIWSILRQTYPIYELIVLDDASTDGSKELAKELVLDLQLKKPEMRVKFLGNDQNSGKAMRQWEKGVKEATGDYIWIAEADDRSSPKFLEEVMKGFDDPEVVLAYAESAIINGAGLVIAPNFRWSRDREKTGHFAQSYTKNGEDEIREIMAIRCTIPNVSGVVFKNTAEFRRTLAEAAEKYEQVGDWHLYLKLLAGGKIAYNKKALNKFRVHKGSATKRGAEHLKEVVGVHKAVREKYELDARVLEAIEAEEMRIREKYGIME